MNFTELTHQSIDDIQRRQEHRFRELLSYLNRYSPFYRKLFAKHKVDICSIKTLDDINRLPITTKEDLQHHNADFVCVEKRDIIEYTSTSGTLGSPVTIALTENDLRRLGDNEYHSFLTADGSAHDIYQLMLTLDRQFMAGMAYYSGIRKLGGGIIRLGPGVPSLQWETILRLNTTAIVTVPSFILKLIQHARDNNIDINASSVTKAICIGENIRNPDLSLNALGKRIKEAWNIQLYSTYASTEMQTAFTECSQGCGGHYQPYLLITELLDENDQPVQPHVPGEVTITTLGVEGMPLLRYKTGDICMYYDEPCGCGRTTPRLSPVIGRKKQMIKFKGTTLYPSALFDLLNELDDILDYVIEVNSNEVNLDEVLLYVIPVVRNEETDRRIRGNLQARLRVTPVIRYVTAEEMQSILPEAGRKAVKFIDKRK